MMREEMSNKKSKVSWSKSLVRKWFNIKNKSQDFHADYDATTQSQGRDGGERRTSCSERDAGAAKKSSRTDRSLKRNVDRIRRGRNEFDVSRLTETQDYRIFASTWNVGGKSPSRGLDLDDWLHSSPPADIYVLGFQEIVPLNAGNVLGTEDNVPAKKWVSLVRRTLNKNPGPSSHGGYRTPSPVPDPVVELDADFEGSSRRQDSSSFFHRRSFQNLSRSLRVEGNDVFSEPRLDRRFSVCDPLSYGGRPSDFGANCQCIGSPDVEYIEEDASNGTYFSPFPYGYGGSTPMEENNQRPNTSRYCLVASKQMVGIFLTVWVRSEIRADVRNLKVSCVGRGLMGYLVYVKERSLMGFGLRQLKRCKVGFGIIFAPAIAGYSFAIFVLKATGMPLLLLFLQGLQELSALPRAYVLDQPSFLFDEMCPDQWDKFNAHSLFDETQVRYLAEHQEHIHA